jgi:predicted porin
MQKKIIALAIASAMTVPALAYAEATVSGQVNMSIDHVNDGNSPSASVNQLNSNQSRLIVKGNEDLGNGMSAIAQLDMRMLVDTGTTSSTTGKLLDGNNYLGLKSDSIGTLMAGRIDSPYKSSTRNLDVFFDVAGDNRKGVGAVGGLLANDLRYDNAINYISPNMGGFSVAAGSVFGAETPVANSTKGSLYSLAGMFSTNNIYATLAYLTKKFGTGGTGDLGTGGAVNDKATALKLGGGFMTDMFAVNAVIERPTTTVAATGVKTSNTNVYLAGKFNVSSTDSVRLAFTKRGAQSGIVNDAKQYAIGYEHGMSKATSVYATYVKTTDNTLNVADPSALSFGMKHSF